MRVALVMSRFPVLSERFLVDKVVGLARAGVDVHVVADEIDTLALDAVADRNDLALHHRVHATPAGARTRPRMVARAVPHPGAVRRGFRELPRPRRLVRLAHDLPLFELRPDLVHTEFLTLARGRTHLPATLGRPLTSSVRGFDVTYAGLGDPDHYTDVWPTLSGLHVLGADLLERVRARGGGDVPHRLIPPALDVATFDQADPGGPVDQGRPLRLVSVGRLHWKKAHHHTLAALRLVLDAGVPARLRILGGGEALEHIAFTRHQLGLDDHVDLLGPSTPDQVRAELASAQVFTHSAVTEGYSNAVLEAQAAGLPVVATDAEGLAENLDPGRTGLIVPRRDPAAMAEALVTLAGDPERRRAMGEAGRRRAATRTIDGQVRAFVEFFADAVTMGPRRP